MRSRGLIEHMGNLASQMWSQAVNCWCERDRSAAAALGERDDEMNAWFEGLEIGCDDSQTVISGRLTDQAALYGVLNRICDLGLVLISVRRSDPE